MGKVLICAALDLFIPAKSSLAANWKGSKFVTQSMMEQLQVEWKELKQIYSRKLFRKKHLWREDTNYILTWVFPKIMVPPKSSILIGFSLIFTIHFGGEKTPIFGNILTSHQKTRNGQWRCWSVFEWVDTQRNLQKAFFYKSMVLFST